MVVYGRNPVRELLHGARAASVKHVWATQATAREPWLTGDPRLVQAPASELEGLCRSPSHQGVCAQAGAYPYRELFRLFRETGYDRVTLCEVGKSPPDLDSGIEELRYYKALWSELNRA